MAVVTSGSETIVRYSLGLIGIYYVLVGGSWIICACSLMVALGTALESGSWIAKTFAVVSWVGGALMFGLMAIQLYSTARQYRHTYVAIGPEGLRIKLPHSNVHEERRYQWTEIAGLTYEHNLRKRICRFTGGDFRYTLTQNNCPSPGKVAQLIAERKGVPLEAPGSLA